MIVSTRERSEEKEIMDDFDMRGELLADTLDKLARINRQLGGNGVTVSAVRDLVKDLPQGQVVKMIDLGCGDGDMLRLLADMFRKLGRPVEIIGLDANAYIIECAQARSQDYPEISYLQMDVFSERMQRLDYDIALATLFMHHIPDEGIEQLLGNLSSKARLGVVINDLHRSKIAYYLFSIYSLTARNYMIRHDGLISVLRAFKRQDLERISAKLGLQSEISWKWAFRYQWVIRSAD